MSELTLEKYSDRSFLIKGNTKPHKEILKQIGGSWNPTLQGYIFSNKHLEAATSVVNKLNSNPNHSFDNLLPGNSTANLIPVNTKVKTFTYNIYVPDVKEVGTINIDGNKLSVIVSNVANDTIYLDYNYNGTTLTFKAMITNGKWQVHGEQREHTITFP